jgi:hypothetical protein
MISVLVTPFNELEIRTAEIVLLHEILEENRLPWRLLLNPLNMKAELRKMALERLGGRLPRHQITYPSNGILT